MHAGAQAAKRGPRRPAARGRSRGRRARGARLLARVARDGKHDQAGRDADAGDHVERKAPALQAQRVQAADGGREEAARQAAWGPGWPRLRLGWKPPAGPPRGRAAESLPRLRGRSLPGYACAPSRDQRSSGPFDERARSACAMPHCSGHTLCFPF